MYWCSNWCTPVRIERLGDPYKDQGLPFTTDTGGADQPTQPQIAFVRIAPQESGSPPHPLPRSQVHLSPPDVHARGAPEDGSGDPRSLPNLFDLRHLLPHVLLDMSPSCPERLSEKCHLRSIGSDRTRPQPRKWHENLPSEVAYGAVPGHLRTFQTVSEEVFSELRLTEFPEVCLRGNSATVRPPLLGKGLEIHDYLVVKSSSLVISMLSLIERATGQLAA